MFSRTQILHYAGAPFLGRHRTLWIPLGIWAASLIALFAAYLAGEPPEALLRDPAATFRASPLTGLLSHIGMLAMAISATVSLFVASHVGLDHIQTIRRLRHAGLLSVAIATDDLLMLHESLGPNILGIPEQVFMAAYAWAAVSLLWIHRKTLTPIRAPLLWAALGALALSVGADMLFAPAVGIGPVAIAEDVFKLLGFLLWAGFWIGDSDAVALSLPVRADRHCEK